MNNAGTENRLARAKRIFIANVVILGFALAMAIFILNDDSGANTTEVPEDKTARPLPTKSYTREELAYLKGQVLALRQHPKTMPAFDEEWVLTYCSNQVKRDSQIKYREGENIDPIINEFVRGYTERFEDY